MILNINKPVGWTSFDVVKKIRAITKEKKVGHGGTLDPFAEGVLIIATGKDTKTLSEFIDEQKQYKACLKLGVLTDTHDIEGKTIKEMRVPCLSEGVIKNVLNSFKGYNYQIPPMYSAKKVDGKRLYELARKNITIERKPNKVKIYSINLITFGDDSISFKVCCSKGTYIRVLGKEIAEKMGTVGHIKNLVRTHVGSYNISNAKTIEYFYSSWKVLKSLKI